MLEETSEQILKQIHEDKALRKPGSNILSFPVSRRSEQTGVTQRSFPARWLALILMGSVGAAWALNPTAEEGGGDGHIVPRTRVVVEGEPQMAAQLVGSLFGEVPKMDSKKVTPIGVESPRIVFESMPIPQDDGGVSDGPRASARFLRMVEEVEAEYMARGRYPALPGTDGQDLSQMTYRTDGTGFTLASGRQRYTADKGLSLGKAPNPVQGFAVKASLRTEESGWGPWREENVVLEAKRKDEDISSLDFLKDLPAAPPWSARMFFPVSRETCGYYFQRPGGESAYSSGELTYEAVGGSFSLKLYREGDVSAQSLDPIRLEKELDRFGGSTALIGESALLKDLGLLQSQEKGEEVVAVSTSVDLPCASSGSLDGLRLAALSRHKIALPSGKFLAKDGEGEVSLVGNVRMIDRLGQFQQVRLRAGRGANYDWIVGQICPLSEEVRWSGYQEMQPAPWQEKRTVGSLVKAGQ